MLYPEAAGYSTKCRSSIRKALRVRNGKRKKKQGKRGRDRGVGDVVYSQDFVVFNYFQPVRQNMFYLCYADNICARGN